MLNTVLGTSLTAEAFLLCLFAAVLLGACNAGFYAFRNDASRHFLSTLVLLPAIVQTVIMLVNGNVGTGIAVAGAFSLVRFRSAPGNAGEISAIFLAMAVGLACGMGYLFLAAVLAVVLGLISIALRLLPIGKRGKRERELKVLMPENLDYTEIFDDIFEKYTAEAELQRVRTVNLGSLYELRYRIRLKNGEEEKEMLDALRVRNGNLELVCGRVPDREEAL